jgi:hypothetical protein
VPCDHPHGYKAIVVIPAGTDQTDCHAEFAGYVNLPFAESVLSYVVMLPHEEEQASGVPFVCAAFQSGPDQ